LLHRAITIEVKGLPTGSGYMPTWCLTASKAMPCSARRIPCVNPADHDNGQLQGASNASVLLYGSGEFSTGIDTGICVFSFQSKKGHRIPVVIHVKRASYLPRWGWQLCREMGGSFAV